jgi:alpha-beta hydrolase superfamily lysophospholipase
MSLGHQRVSLGWGRSLLEIEEFTHSTLLSESYTAPFLFTQGGSDEVCPASDAEHFFNQLNFPNKQFQLFPEMRHETFAESRRGDLFDCVGKWLDRSYLAQQTKSTKTRYH